ncbi:MAG TPA: sigma 54-interacting transcriptional regulator [Bryobacteraceae bacterium]|jgi:transcriptional regulator with PAS, ATPase and Fis domain|nr:sigma 54-interacting transcriptional regulator [Bryobacteraceae bacterium]
MKFIWVKSIFGESGAFPREWGDIAAVEGYPDDDRVHRMAVRHGGPVVLEVRETADVGPAMEIAGESGGAYAVWIWQPSASPASATAFLKAGASQVVTTLGELKGLADHVVSNTGIGLARNERRALIGSSLSIRSIDADISLVASRRCNVLIEGETGTGKEVVAREIHRTGNRSRGPWVAVNCGAIPDTLLEAELFGHVKGAFTGAMQGRAGKFEAANHGTIFLDEIGDMPFAVQAKLLRVLQEKEIERLGGNERIHLDVRVIAATNVNLHERVEAGLFREDLYYRLNVFAISLPPLRERPEDLPELARHFAGKTCAAEGVRSKDLDPSAIDRLLEHYWPGNVRELENVMELAVILSGSRSTIFASDIRIAPRPMRHQATESSALTANPARISLPSAGLDYQQTLETFEHDLLTQALARTRGNKTAAAELLGLKRTTLSARMRVLEARMPRLVA